MSKNSPRNYSDLNFVYHSLKNLPDKKVTSNIVDIAEKKRILPTGSPFPGKYKYRRTPYMYEIAMELSPQSDTEVINVMKAGQMGATAGSSENLILFKISDDPGPVLAMVPNADFGKKWDESRLSPMLEESGLMTKLKSTVKKSSQHGGNGNTSLKKSWPGGRLDILSFAQVNQLRNQSYQIIIIEDAEEIGNTAQRGVFQGSLKDVAFTRSMTFSGRRKILDISTPLIKEFSTIYKAFLEGDQRYYYINCPHCGHSQRLEWKHLKYNADDNNIVDPDSVYYACQGEECDYHILNHEKTDFLLCEQLGGTAKWKPHNEEKARPLTKSYQFSALYAPVGMDSWYQLAQQWVDSKNDPEKLQAFINLKLGEPYEDHGDSPPAETLYALQGNYKRGFLPHPENEGMPLFTMIGADVQRGNKRGGEYVKGKEPRIEASLVGFGLNNRTWLIDHYVIKGEVHDHNSGAFRKFREMIEKQKFPIMPEKIFIDAGYETDTVKKFCNNSQKVFPIKGVPFISEKALFKRVDLQEYNSGLGGPLPYYELRNDPIKMRIYNRMGLRADQGTGEYPDGYMMFPSNMEHKYFEQLTNERRLVKKTEGGRTKVYFDAGGRPNEALDTYCYAMQACEVFKYEMCLFWGLEATDERIFWQRAATKFAFRLAG